MIQNPKFEFNTWELLKAMILKRLPALWPRTEYTGKRSSMIAGWNRTVGWPAMAGDDVRQLQSFCQFWLFGGLPLTPLRDEGSTDPDRLKVAPPRGIPPLNMQLLLFIMFVFVFMCVFMFMFMFIIISVFLMSVNNDYDILDLYFVELLYSF